MKITAIRTFSRARPTTPRQNTSRFRTASFSKANTSWFAAQPMKTKPRTMIATTAHSGSQWNSRQRRKISRVRSVMKGGMAPI